MATPKPFRKFNFLSRKKKDELNLAHMKSEAAAGRDYAFVKKSNKPMDVGGKIATKRGTVVLSDVSREPLKIKKPSVSFEMRLTAGKTNRKYEPVDVRTGHVAYGPESLTKPVPEFIKEARAKKKDIVYKGGLPYRAGEWVETRTPDISGSSMKFTKADIKPASSSVRVKVMPSSVAKLSEDDGTRKKRRMYRVPWLNPRSTQEHITPERRRKKKEAGY